MNLVRQRDRHDCIVACLAMVSGQSYEQVAAAINLPLSGGHRGHIEEFLYANGYVWATACRFPGVGYGGVERVPWPPAPFADMHLVELQMKQNQHLVVWLRDGAVLDPARPGPGRLKDYSIVNNVRGIWRIR